MRRRKIWYKRQLFKHHFKSYKEWDKFNPPSDFKHPIRYKSDALICRNPDCPREQMPISEHEAYYYFAKKFFWKKFLLEISLVFKSSKAGRETGHCYVCPFCGGSEVEEFEKWILFRDPRVSVPRRRQYEKSMKAERSRRAHSW